MVLKTVFLPGPTYSVPSMAGLSINCTAAEPFDESSELENEIAEILPIFKSADKDWNSFGYLLDLQEPSTSNGGSKSDSEASESVFRKPVVEPIGKGRRRRRHTVGAKPKAEVKKEVINPADITLGGDTYDYKEEQKPEDSIASGVARRRRTSANLSKSEDENPNAPALTTRGSKERRTSEPQTRQFFGYGPTIDIDVGVLHCVCQQVYDAAKLYVQCEMCARWYHGECVDVSERKAQQLEHWTCEQCVEEQERVKEQPALYCVCRKPYDDTRFYVGCDSCQGWFHPECVGITRAEAERAAEYNCPECARDLAGYESEASEASVTSRASSLYELKRVDYVYVMQLLELLLEHRMSTPFRNPVDLDKFPDYEQVVKKPMDLSTINQKVEDLQYAYLRDFVNDVHLMFENAKTYNPKDHAVFKCAEIMQEVFEKKLLEVKATMQANHEPAGGPSVMHSARKRVQSESQRTVDSLDIDSDQLLPLDQSVLRFFNF